MKTKQRAPRRAATVMAKSNWFSEAQVEQFLQSDLVEGFADMSPGDIQLAMDDRGWVRMGQTLDGDAPWSVRRLTVLRSRMYWLMDSHAQAAVRTWTDYTLGSGMGFKANKDPDQTALSEFWDNKQNRNITSAESQRRLNRRLLVDGELFFGIFDTDDGVLVRKIDCTQITNFLTNPDDSEEVWGYRRVYSLTNGETKTLIYRDWAYPEADLSKCSIIGNPNTTTPQEHVVVYHLPFNAIHQRGNSLFSSALPWMQALRQFMEDRLAITQGLAKFIRKMTIKGGAAQVAKVQAAMTGAVSQGAAGNPALDRARKAAQTLFANDAVDMADVPRTTGASDSRQDFRNIRLMICGGVGMTEPYFGDAEAGNLASVTAMELPMLKQFESHQQLWADCWRDLFSIVLNFEDPQAVQVAIDWPPIVKENVKNMVDAIVAACAEFPELNQPEVLTVLLNSLGINNVDHVMTNVLAKQKELQLKADTEANNAAKGLAPDGTAISQPVVGPAKPAQQATGTPTAPIQRAAGESTEAYGVRLLEAHTNALLEALDA